MVPESIRTYVKIEGDNVGSIVRKLAQLTIDFPKICVWDLNMADWSQMPQYESQREDFMNYFDVSEEIFNKHCDRIISKSGTDLGDAQIYFEWLTPPDNEQLYELRKMIDRVIKPFGNKYTVTNK